MTVLTDVVRSLTGGYVHCIKTIGNLRAICCDEKSKDYLTSLRKFLVDVQEEVPELKWNSDTSPSSDTFFYYS